MHDPSEDDIRKQQEAFLKASEGVLLGPDGKPAKSGSEEIREPIRLNLNLPKNRAERRAARKRLRAFRRRAARARDSEASAWGIGTPGGDVSDWVRAYHWRDDHMQKGIRPPAKKRSRMNRREAGVCLREATTPVVLP